MAFKIPVTPKSFIHVCMHASIRSFNKALSVQYVPGTEDEHEDEHKVKSTCPLGVYILEGRDTQNK